MEYRQSLGFGTNTTSFIFHEDKLEYSFRNGNVFKSHLIAYDRIPMESVGFKNGNPKLVRRILLWCFAISPGIWTGLYLQDNTLGECILGTVFFVVALASVISAATGARKGLEGTQYKTPPFGELVIIKDASHDAIVDLINERRRAVVRSKLGRVDTTNNSEQERRKFRWLKDNGYISEQEMNLLLAELSAPSTATPFTLDDARSTRMS
jgi:hypothetical protein